MKRYGVFGGPCYYAAGGFHDFAGSFDSLDEAREFATRKEQIHPDIDRTYDVFEWWHIFDFDTRQPVEASQYQGYGAPDELPEV